jgi:hypothetical protein
MPCSLRGKPRHITINARRFQKGEWEALWTQALRHINREVAHRAKKLDGKPLRQLPFARARSICRILLAKGRLVKGNPSNDLGSDPFRCPYQH